MSAARTSPGLELAKALLWGVALLGCPVRSVESECGDPGIELSVPENASIVKLHCCVIRNVTSLYWAHNGYRLPASAPLRGSSLIEVPIEEARGIFECHVQYTPTLGQIATIILDFSVKKDTSMTSGVVLIIILGIGFLVLILSYLGWVIKQRQTPQQNNLQSRSLYRRRLFRARRGVNGSLDRRDVNNQVNPAAAV